MKDQFLYASTLYHGLQVIDVGQAIAEFQQTDASTFGQAVSTEGAGFAMDAVVNTIPIYANNASAILWDVKAADFATGPLLSDGSPPPTQTLMVATGAVPLVVADPQQGGSSAIFYPMADGTTVPASSPGAGLANLSSLPLQSSDGKFKLQRGRAIALGTAFVAQSQGNSTQEQIAVIVGTGIAPPFPDGTPAQGVLAVVNMNDPKHPVPQGFAGLTSSPTDVVVRGSIAIIGTSLNKILLANITDPAQPIAAGEINPSPGLLLGNNVTVTDSGLIISSSPSTGGLQISQLGNACRGFRDQINHGPHVDPVSYPLKSLDWTIGGGSFSTQDGFMLTGVQMGDRLMANKMSLPYFIIKRNSSDPTMPSFLQCVLSSNNPAACAGSTTARSQLFDFKYEQSDGNKFALQAKYLLDRMDGDTDNDPSRPDSCVLVTQRYEFSREGHDAPEASDELSAARFKPTLQYQYFTDVGPSIGSFTAAQRFQFAPTAFEFNAISTPPTFFYEPSSNEVASFFLDCELSDVPVHGGCVNFLTDIDHLGTATPLGNPIPNEASIRVIQNGQVPSALSTASTTGDPASPLKRSDNLHLRAYFDSSGSGGAPIEGPTTTGHPGCPECVHIHWRWGSILQRSNPVGGLVVSPRFSNKGLDNIPGDPIIPSGSNQDVDVGVLVANIGGGPGTEEHPSFPQTYLDFATEKAINGQQPLSFWYSATGHSSQDSFMMHGGFFSSMRVTISNPYIINSVLGAVFPLQLQDFIQCAPGDEHNGQCPIISDIQNRTGHNITWTATVKDSSGNVVFQNSGSVAGRGGREVPGSAKVYIPATIQLFPTYILDIRVEDDITHWSTERQAYVTVGGITSLLVPLFP